MKKYQKGEVTLVVMVVMMAVIWMFSGHMGMGGHRGDYAEKSDQVTQQVRFEPPMQTASKESSDYQYDNFRR